MKMGDHLRRSRADREAGKPLPLDQARAFRLDQELFGQSEDLIRGKSLIIVPLGPLTQTPFQVLIPYGGTLNGDTNYATR